MKEKNEKCKQQTLHRRAHGMKSLRAFLSSADLTYSRTIDGETFSNIVFLFSCLFAVFSRFFTRKNLCKYLYSRLSHDNVRNMRTKITVFVLLAICSIGGVVAFLELHNSRADANLPISSAVKPDLTNKTNFDLSAMVNETIIVEGKLYGPRTFLPEGRPPYDYELISNGTTIGVYWNDTSGFFYDFANVRVYGVVTEGRLAGGISEPPASVCFIKAERIDLL